MARRKNISKQTRLLLSTLLRNPETWQYGYEISKKTGLKSGVLYPILMRLHKQGYLISDWQAPQISGRPPRHIYRLSETGVALAHALETDDSLQTLTLPHDVKP